MKINLMIVVVAVLITGGLGVFGGIEYQKANTRPLGPGGQLQAQNGQGRPGGVPGRDGAETRGGGSPVSGEILEIDGQTITVQTQEGENKIIVYSGSTNINKTSEGSSSDLKIGEEVMVIGNEEDNGAITAQTISIGGSGLFRRISGGQPTTEDK